jgi:DNA-binding transcriptional regulator YiaG
VDQGDKAMKKYKSASFKYLHEEMKNLHASGDITAEKLAEFERDCFVSPTGTSQSRATHAPAMASASPGHHGPKA